MAEGVVKAVIALATIAVVLAVTFIILADTHNEIEEVEGDYNNDSVIYNASIDTINATADIPGWLPVIVIVVIGGILIGLVSRFGKS